MELCSRLGAPELGHSEDYKHNELRVRNRSVLLPTLTQIIKQKTNSEWCQIFEVSRNHS